MHQEAARQTSRFTLAKLTLLIVALDLTLRTVSAFEAEPNHLNGKEVETEDYLETNAIDAPSLKPHKHRASSYDTNKHANENEKSATRRDKIKASQQQLLMEEGQNMMRVVTVAGRNIDDKKGSEPCNRLLASDSQQHKQDSAIPSIGAADATMNDQKLEHITKLFQRLQANFVEQVIRQRVTDKDHLLMEKWLVDNIKDLHRELKQTEMDFEHYVEVTKNILARNERAQLKHELALQTSLPLWSPLPIATGIGGDGGNSNAGYDIEQRHHATLASGHQMGHNQKANHYLAKLLLAAASHNRV